MSIPNESAGHNGRSLDQKAWRRTVRTLGGRALLARGLYNGGIYLHALSQGQAAKVAGCTLSQLRAVNAASTKELAALARGCITLGTLMKKPAGRRKRHQDCNCDMPEEFDDDRHRFDCPSAADVAGWLFYCQDEELGELEAGGVFVNPHDRTQIVLLVKNVFIPVDLSPLTLGYSKEPLSPDTA
jgi:hypothetical protein